MRTGALPCQECSDNYPASAQTVARMRSTTRMASPTVLPARFCGCGALHRGQVAA